MNSTGRRRPFASPEPTIVAISRIADRVLTGEIVLPRYQRAFVWSPHQILDLLDSVLRNYPIGSMLLWETTEQIASEQTVAGLAVDPPPRDQSVRYILDGQQRLASIIGALHGGTGLWDIAYDLAEERFFQRTPDSPTGPHIVSMRQVSAAGSLFRQVADLSPELRERATDLYEQFANYLVPVVTLKHMSAEESSRVFVRINSMGTPMNIVDVARAGTWSPDFDLKEEIESLLRVLDAKLYGRVDTKTMLRTIAVAAGFGFSAKDINRLRELDKDRLRAAVDDAAKAAARAVDFLSTQIRTPRADALPYYNQFAVLVEVFRQLPKPSSGQFDALRRWFWLTASGEYFKGWSDTQMVPDLQAITAFASGETQEFETGAALPRSALWRRSAFSKRNAPSKLLALLLAYEEPRDLLTGLRIDVGRSLSWQNDKEFHHFFPKAFLRSRGVSGARANVCGNLVMLTSHSNIWVTDRAPSQYLRDLADTEGEEALRERLRTCLVEEDAYQAALRDDYDTFLRVRSETLHRRLMELIGQAAGSSNSAAKRAAQSMADDNALEEDADPDSLIDEPVDRDSAD
ncbi:GmrSD restriction endonuclease domain-containing protein [Nocardia sp. IBHARD005]|uniref:GmrSD restriction endonuclease domain-containing protein n=1 Tax=Nocardia sp. IBHARD005 TaxID=3457765 RepID=UPI0040593550